MPSVLDPVIFLDIDGVLNDHSRMSNHYCGTKKECVDSLNLILNAVPTAKIVISSAWRYMILRGHMTLIGFEQMLLTHGVDCLGRIIGNTAADVPVESESGDGELDLLHQPVFAGRGQQIREWASTNGVAKFVALDDLRIGIPEHYHVNGSTGLTEFDVGLIVSLIA